ncbi:MAG TPA: hypothetical protein VN023_08240 [Methylovorus sp.]|jgi:hypothetical protein|nr:hypothetical protein [Methylovorus sp.]
MTPQQIVGLAVRLFSIWLFIFSFSIYGYISALSNQPGFEPYPLKYPIVVFIMVLSILLWFFPMSVAHRLIPKTKYENILNIQSQEAVRVACIVFALLIFTVQVLPAIAYYLPLSFYISRQHQSTLDYEQFHYLKIGPFVIEFIVALVLTFKSRSISKYLMSFGAKESNE